MSLKLFKVENSELEGKEKEGWQENRKNRHRGWGERRECSLKCDIDHSERNTSLFLKLIFVFTSFFFYQVFISKTLKAHRTVGERRGLFFYSTLPLPPAHEQSDIYLQLWISDDYHIFYITPLLFTRLPLDEIYHLIVYLSLHLTWFW